MSEKQPKNALNQRNPTYGRQIDLEEGIKEVNAPAAPFKIPSVTWSIRGVSAETRKIIEVAAEVKGMTIGHFVNERVKILVQNDLDLKRNDLEAKIDDLATLIRQSQLEILELLKGQPVKSSFFERLFKKGLK